MAVRLGRPRAIARARTRATGSTQGTRKRHKKTKDEKKKVYIDTARQDTITSMMFTIMAMTKTMRVVVEGTKSTTKSAKRQETEVET